MSYIINNKDAFVNLKLTEKGRERLASGKLTFSYWGVGDSEINYDREYTSETFSDTNISVSGDSKILRPVDRQPNIKSFVTINGLDTVNTLNSSDIRTVKLVANNLAKERGFFSADTTHSTFVTYTADPFVLDSGFINTSTISGGTNLVIGTGNTLNVGDFLLLKISNNNTGPLTPNLNDVPVPYLWYKIQGITTTSNLNDTIILDRDLPNLSGETTQSQWYIYSGLELYDWLPDKNEAYWNINTLEFTSCCDVSCFDVPFWNMNNVWSENLAGQTGSSVNILPSTPNESFEEFGSNEYLGFKYPYLSLVNKSTSNYTDDVCASGGDSVVDDVKKSISIIHYTNYSINNNYGEFFHIDVDSGKLLRIYLPTIMYHRRNFSTESGTTIGMSFVSTGDTKLIENTNIEYYDLIEDPSLVSSQPKVVGMVLPQHKIVVITDDEIVAATSYKSNRNWTLPELKGNLVSPTGGSTGILEPNKTMYFTYIFENNSTTGLTTSLPCQNYSKIINTTSSNKDVSFKFSSVDLLPYMRKIEKSTYDGFGFYATNFKVLYQIVDNYNDRPDPSKWKVYDYTSTSITGGVNETIDPKLIENQNISSFVIDTNIDSLSTYFDLISILNMANHSNQNILQFGDERFFYGNLETYIGATIYKTIFNISISGDMFKFTSNPTRDDSSPNPTDIRISEVGIYDNDSNLVMVGKLSKPIKLSSGNTIRIEMSIDF